MPEFLSVTDMSYIRTYTFGRIEPDYLPRANALDNKYCLYIHVGLIVIVFVIFVNMYFVLQIFSMYNVHVFIILSFRITADF